MYPGPLAIVGLPVHATYHSAPYPRYGFGTLIQPNGSIFQEKATTVPAFRISHLRSAMKSCALFSAYLSSHCQGVNSKSFFFHNHDVGYSDATGMFPLYFGYILCCKVSLRPHTGLWHGAELQTSR